MGTPSASINQVRKRPGEIAALSAESGFGLEGNATVTLDGLAPLNAAGTVRGRIVGYGQAGDTTRDDQFTKDGLVYGAIDADIGERTTVGIGLSHQADRIDGYSWGGFWTRTDGSFFDFGADAPRASAGNTSTGARPLPMPTSSTASTAAGPSGALRASTAAADRLSSYATWSADETLTRGGADYDMTEDTIAFDARASGTVTLFGRTHDLVFGANGARVDANYDAFGNTTSSSPIPRGRTPGSTPSPPSAAISCGRTATG